MLESGGMAAIHSACDREGGERVALKVLHPHLATCASMRGRLRREVEAASQLRHLRALVAYELHELGPIRARCVLVPRSDGNGAVRRR